MSIRPGVCVKIPDQRIGRVRDKDDEGKWRVRVRRKNSKTHQFLFFRADQVKVIDCPKGWMSISGYENYLKKALVKMKQRLK